MSVKTLKVVRGSGIMLISPLLLDLRLKIAYTELSKKQPSTALRSSKVRIEGMKGFIGHPRASRLSIIGVGSLSAGLFNPRLPTNDTASCMV